jgi:hypothetical protein
MTWYNWQYEFQAILRPKATYILNLALMTNAAFDNKHLDLMIDAVFNNKHSTFPQCNPEVTHLILTYQPYTEIQHP